MTHVSTTQSTAKVIVGVDTHADIHVAAAIDPLGRLVGRLEIPTTPSGYGRLLSWSRELDADVVFGIEGTGAYGAGLARFLTAAGCAVAEINRPDRRGRRSHGKSDPLDAEAAARSVLAGAVAGVAKADHDRVGMIKTLRVARRSALKMRTQVINQMKALVITSPDELRSRLRQLTNPDLVAVSAAARPGLIATPLAAAKLALRSLAIRHQGLSAELQTLDVELCRLTAEVAPVLSMVRVWAPMSLAHCSLLLATTRSGCGMTLRSPVSAASRRFPPRPARRTVIDSTAVATASRTTRSGASSWSA